MQKIVPAGFVLTGLFAALFSNGAAAQYPAKPIRLLVGFPAGGGPDIVGRLIGAKLGESLGQPVVVENRVGSTGSIAGAAVAKSAAEGYTLLVGQDSLFVINPHICTDMPLDPLKDLAPIASLVSNGFFIAVNSAVPAQTLPEFIEYAKRANPPLHYASGGSGSQHHMTMERGKARAGLDMIHVPCKGGAPATTANSAPRRPLLGQKLNTGPIIAGRQKLHTITEGRQLVSAAT